MNASNFLFSKTTKLLLIAGHYLMVLAIFASQGVYAQSFTDDRDGREYRTVEINGKTWMAQNLNYEVKGSYYYQNDTRYRRAGRLYTWDAAAQRACPEGWRIPTVEEWDEMIKSSGGWTDGYGDLVLNGNSGFNAAWGGLRFPNGNFRNKTKVGSYWSSKTVKTDYSKAVRFNFRQEERVIKKTSIPKSFAMSCRCIEDPGSIDDHFIDIFNETKWGLRLRLRSSGEWSDWLEIESGWVAYKTASHTIEDFQVQLLQGGRWESLPTKVSFHPNGRTKFSVVGDTSSNVRIRRR